MQGAGFAESAPVGVIGVGRLGSALAYALDGSSRQLKALATRREHRGEALAQQLQGTRNCAAQELVERCDVVFVTVPDQAIEPTVAALRWRAGQAVVHCSGALDLSVLHSARAAGARVGCLHPLQTFPSESGAERFDGIVCGLEADAPLDGWLQGLAAELGAQTVRLEGVNRVRYHAAAVFASNYVVSTVALAARAWQLAGLDPSRARVALAPLTLGAAENIEDLPLPLALTGPVARGDVETVRAHLEALAGDPEVQELYRRLGAALLGLELDIPPEVRASLEGVLAKGT